MGGGGDSIPVPPAFEADVLPQGDGGGVWLTDVR